MSFNELGLCNINIDLYIFKKFLFVTGPAQLELGTQRIPAFHPLPRGGVKWARPPALEPRGGQKSEK